MDNQSKAPSKNGMFAQSNKPLSDAEEIQYLLKLKSMVSSMQKDFNTALDSLAQYPISENDKQALLALKLNKEETVSRPRRKS